jgi:hypothetical protein
MGVVASRLAKRWNGIQLPIQLASWDGEWVDLQIDVAHTFRRFSDATITTVSFLILSRSRLLHATWQNF